MTVVTPLFISFKLSTTVTLPISILLLFLIFRGLGEAEGASFEHPSQISLFFLCYLNVLVWGGSPFLANFMLVLGNFVHFGVLTALSTMMVRKSLSPALSCPLSSRFCFSVVDITGVLQRPHIQRVQNQPRISPLRLSFLLSVLL